ncbi:MAG: 2Fe-2S iron-sulfur cluster binding domain-containing protein [Burkholderiales bacterium]|nr:2Fe-2S iron-sulfur cluster binding domain-containing protein [Burkholderiales bacterium]
MLAVEGSIGGGTMTPWVTLSRAARLIGVPRGVLQREVADGRLASNDGLVSLDALARLYPDWRPEDSGAFERTAKVREEAFGRRVQERVLPPQEVLAQRLFAQSRELADARAHLSRYHELVVALRERIEGFGRAAPAGALAELAAELDLGLARVLATGPVDALTVMDDMLKIVSAEVTVRPSGRVFFVEGRDSLLQAGLKAGLKLAYGCGNGTCGLCKARVVSGEVVKTMPFDYPLSEAERLQGHTLLCAHSAASSEIVIETLEAQGPSEIPEQEVEVRVRSVAPLAPDTLLVHVQTPRGSRLRFLAGQSATLYGGAADTDAHATWPIASCPCDDRNLHFHVARDARDALATMFFDGAFRPGDALRLWGPSGDFVLAEDTGRPLAFVACDTGYAPIKSLIEHAIAVDAAPAMSLDWLATRSDGHYHANQCRAWAAAFDAFRYEAHQAADAAEGAEALASRMAEALDLPKHDVYVAGPVAFVDAACARLANAGVPAARLRALVL